MIKNSRIPLLLSLLACATASAEVTLPKLISDGMVLQRNTELKIWGWAAVSEIVRVQFLDSTYSTTADNRGDWAVLLSPQEAGGPYQMIIDAGNSITISDILIGDVWICSGQSNMETTMERVSPLYETEIANAENAFIRYFEVPKKYDFNQPHTDLSGGRWQPVHRENILKFSAVSYFFALELYNRYKIPIGLVNTSMGGGPAQSWISEDVLKAFPVYYHEAQLFKDSALIHAIENSDNARSAAWYKELWRRDAGYADLDAPWFAADLETAGWSTMKIPGFWADTDAGDLNGVVWFRKKINVPASMTGKPAKLLLGRIVDADSVYVNGVFVGTTSYQYPPRRYKLSPDLLKTGENIITIRVINSFDKGGFIADKPYQLLADGQSIDLQGDWLYKVGSVMPPLASQTFIRWKPLGLYNAMIAPLLNYRMKGVIWYQGEANVKKPEDYEALLTTMINDWRQKWEQGDFPFLIVQLANYLEAQKQPTESDWALLREAQLKTLVVPNTGMAVAIDLGEWNDIHPLNKKDVAKRLSLAAFKIAYGENSIVHSGPVYQSMKVESNKIILSFSNIGSGLTLKDGQELKGFAVAGENRQFVWAKAKIVQDKVIVWSDQIQHPVAVRYAWADNPQSANLCNAEGLPASPFRTDGWR